MANPVIYDAVTLCHFACAQRLDVLEQRHGHLGPPHWTEAVYDEIVAGANQGRAHCGPVLNAAWLDQPLAPTNADRAGILGLMVGLNDGERPATRHGGEAEGIYFAEKLTGAFVTDDNAAYDFAERRLGTAQVIDTVRVLQDAVSMGELTKDEALDVANSIRVNGRHLRRVHPATLTSAYFS